MLIMSRINECLTALCDIIAHYFFNVINKMHSELSFSALGLRDPLVNNLATLGFETMTPVQSQSLPFLMKGDDLIAQSKTGSGKTAAFGLALLHHLKVEFYSVQALILCPTRELADQVAQEIRRLARLMHNVKVLNLSGGMPFNPQLDSLRHGAHIIVGTPGRVQKHLDKGSLSLKNVRTLVLDEADRMLDMGFFDDIAQIIRTCPSSRQTMLFSATYPEGIKNISQEFMRNPQQLTIEQEADHLAIEQRFYEVSDSKSKHSLLNALLFHYQPSSTLIFCNTKEQTVQVTQQLNQKGLSALTLNGDMEQLDRDLAMIRFTNKSCSILVATDVAARGLDIKELPAVINFDLAFDLDVHIHRIGRTGRAGHKGLALNITTPADAGRLCLIEEHFGNDLIWATQDKLDNNTTPFVPEMVTLCLSVGRKDKIRPGDILGALIKDAGLAKEDIDKINITSQYSYVAIHKNQAEKALQHFKEGKLKGRKTLVRKLV